MVERLKASGDIAAVLRGRRQQAGDHVVIHVRATDGPATARVAVVASRKVGKAVARNRAKRVLREAARHVAWRPGVDVVLVARQSCATARMPQVLDEVTQLAARLDALEPLATAS